MDELIRQTLGYITGPNGGVFALALGLGFMVGYNFAQRTVLRVAMERLEEAQKEIDSAREEIRHWQEAYLSIVGNNSNNNA